MGDKSVGDDAEAREDRAARTLDDLGETQLERFSRQIGLTGFGPEAQLRLLRSRVLVVGAGGLGSPVLSYLAAAGVGEIHVVDDDVVERSNLHRQVIHGEDTVGEPKTASAAARMRALHPEARIVEHRVRLTAENVLELVGAVDLVVDGTDTFATRYLVADACEILGVPVVWGAILRFSGQVSLFHAGHGPVYRDLFPEPPADGEVPTCAQAGVLGVLPGIVGTLMAAEAIKHLSGVGETLLGRVLTVDALTMRFTELRLTPDPGREPATSLDAHRVEARAAEVPSPAAAEAGRAVGSWADEPVVAADRSAAGEISAAHLAAELAGAGAGTGAAVVVVDVREAWERRLGAIEGSLHVPLARIEADPAGAVPADPDATWVFQCAAGSRSARARDLVLAARPELTGSLFSLAGGWEAWSREGPATTASPRPA